MTEKSVGEFEIKKVRRKKWMEPEGGGELDEVKGERTRWSDRRREWREKKNKQTEKDKNQFQRLIANAN